MSSLNQQQQPQLQEVIDQMRDNILRTQSTCNTASITGFDNLVAQLKIFVGQINAQSAEIKRLQGLCAKNNIDYAIPVAAKPAKPAESPKPLKPKN